MSPTNMRMFARPQRRPRRTTQANVAIVFGENGALLHQHALQILHEFEGVEMQVLVIGEDDDDVGLRRRRRRRCVGEEET